MNLGLIPSSPTWVAAAIADLPTLLCDHAHCEKKAAHTALRFIFRYPDAERLVTQLSRLAREELVHFERVLHEMRKRDMRFFSLASSSYAAELFIAAKRPGVSPLVDELLVCALIEARSHVRFERLIEAVDDAELRDFYSDLAEAERRHGNLYIELAQEHAKGALSDQLAELIRKEATIIARPRQPLRMHAGG